MQFEIIILILKINLIYDLKKFQLITQKKAQRFLEQFRQAEFNSMQECNSS